jgi:hypothetical protein
VRSGATLCNPEAKFWTFSFERSDRRHLTLWAPRYEVAKGIFESSVVLEKVALRKNSDRLARERRGMALYIDGIQLSPQETIDLAGLVVQGVLVSEWVNFHWNRNGVLGIPFADPKRASDDIWLHVREIARYNRDASRITGL